MLAAIHTPIHAATHTSLHASIQTSVHACTRAVSYTRELLSNLALRHEAIGDVRGMGLLIGIELIRPDLANIEGCEHIFRSVFEGMVSLFRMLIEGVGFWAK